MGRERARIEHYVIFGAVFVPQWPTAVYGRCPRSGIRPGIYAGLRGTANGLSLTNVMMSAAFTRLLPRGCRSPLKRADERGARRGEEPGVNAGPKTGFAGKRA